MTSSASASVNEYLWHYCIYIYIYIYIFKAEFWKKIGDTVIVAWRIDFSIKNKNWNRIQVPLKQWVKVVYYALFIICILLSFFLKLLLSIYTFQRTTSVIWWRKFCVYLEESARWGILHHEISDKTLLLILLKNYRGVKLISN